ncbi:MAG: hypothetical protein M1309_02270 [Actinobacteria bacterium]|nr:hypothetical protein [Actinomycetota bacterium]
MFRAAHLIFSAGDNPSISRTADLLTCSARILNHAPAETSFILIGFVKKQGLSLLAPPPVHRPDLPASCRGKANLFPQSLPERQEGASKIYGF